MARFRMEFAGVIKKAELKQGGGKQLCEIAICKKNQTKEGEEPTFTWLNLTLWQPADFQLPCLHKGAFIAGSGEFALRSYEKDGEKRQNAEVRCRSFDVEVWEGTPAVPAQAPQPQAPAALKSRVVHSTPKATPPDINDTVPF